MKIENKNALTRLYNLYVNETKTQAEYYYMGMYYKKIKNTCKMIKYFKLADIHEESLNELYEHKDEFNYRHIGYIKHNLKNFSSIRSIKNMVDYHIEKFTCDFQYDSNEYPELRQYCKKYKIPHALYGMGMKIVMKNKC